MSIFSNREQYKRWLVHRTKSRNISEKTNELSKRSSEWLPKVLEMMDMIEFYKHKKFRLICVKNEWEMEKGETFTSQDLGHRMRLLFELGFVTKHGRNSRGVLWEAHWEFGSHKTYDLVKEKLCGENGNN